MGNLNLLIAVRLLVLIGPSVLAADQDMDICLNENYVIQHLLNDSKYNKDVLPVRGGVKVVTELHIQDIPDLSELKADFEMDVLFSAIWRDPRLSYVHLQSCDKNITINIKHLEDLWSPNMCIINSKAAHIHKSPSPNAMLILYENGTVWINYRMRLRAPCEIDLRNYPFDVQECFVIIESYSFHSQKVQLEWLPFKPITFMREENQLPDFKLDAFKTQKMQQEYPNGMWDELRLTLTFRRRYGFFILQAYIPTYMIIFVAWIGFWMEPKQISARATLGISSFLAMTLQFGNILQNQPPVSYIKAMDVWMLCGISFMFATLAELAVVSWLQRSHISVVVDGSPVLTPHRKLLTPIPAHIVSRKNGSTNLKSMNSFRFMNGFTGVQDARTGATLPNRKSWSVEPEDIDRWCRWAFPTTFLVFNIFYWTYYVGALSV